MKIYTIGYEGTTIEEFVAFIVKSKIQIIADLRNKPISRKKGFSKNKLADRLAQAGVGYLHFSKLGVHSEWRKKEKAGEITRRQMFRYFEKKVLTRETESLEELLALVQKKRTALLCFEADASDCHRSYVVNSLREMTKEKVDVVDLSVQAAPQETSGKRPRIFSESSP